MNKAVFLDRDGVINPLVYNVNTGEYESPHYPEDFSVFTYVLKSLRILKDLGFINIIVSNQPSYAKGKTSMGNLKDIEDLLYMFSEENGKLIEAYYYCYHHPQGIVPEYTTKCFCRKPGTLFLEAAIAEYDLDVHSCYFIGDQDTDIKCGNSMGVYTIKVNNKHSLQKSGRETPCATAANLHEAVMKIASKNNVIN
jgi:D-glycero-D-manno-heptose 1,7-bisphosphate phosphatase